jgi:hypothetical protein
MKTTRNPFGKIKVASLRLLVALIVFGFTLAFAYAQVGGSFDLSWNTIDGGGGTFSTGSSYTLGGTIGQPDAGAASGGQYALNGGFWGGAAEHPATTPTVTTTATATPIDTATNTPTAIASATLTPTSTATETDTPTATDTETPTAASTSTSTIIPTDTPTDTPTVAPTHTQTHTPTDTPTATDTATATSTPTPSSTLTSTPSSTSTTTTTATATVTTTASPTATVTSASTTAATTTATRTATRTATKTVTPTVTVTRTRTPTPSACNLCSVSVTAITISCNPDGTVHWTATIHNNSSCLLQAVWGSSLEVRQGNGEFRIVRAQAGNGSFPPGDSVLSGDFCYVFSPGTTAMRVETALASKDSTCIPHSASPSMPPCLRTQACPSSAP